MNVADLDDSQYITVKCGTCADFFPLRSIKEHCSTCIDHCSKNTIREDSRAQVSTVEITSIHLYLHDVHVCL